MGQPAPIQQPVVFALQAEFQKELDRLVQAERHRGHLEAVLRMRALAELADLLATEALVELAATVCVTRAAGSVAVRKRGDKRQAARSATAPATPRAGAH